MSTLKANTISSISGTHCDFTNQEGVKARMNYNDNTPHLKRISMITETRCYHGKFTPNWTK